MPRDRFRDSINVNSMSECIPALVLDSTFIFPAVCFDVTLLSSGFCALSPEPPNGQHVLYEHWTVCMYWCISTLIVVVMYCLLAIDVLLLRLSPLHVLWRCMTDNMETWTWWTVWLCFLNTGYDDDSPRLSWWYRITWTTLPYFGNLYLYFRSLFLITKLSVTAAPKSNYTIFPIIR